MQDAFLEYSSSGTLIIKRLECQITLMYFGASMPKDLNNIARIG